MSSNKKLKDTFISVYPIHPIPCYPSHSSKLLPPTAPFGAIAGAREEKDGNDYFSKKKNPKS